MGGDHRGCFEVVGNRYVCGAAEKVNEPDVIDVDFIEQEGVVVRPGLRERERERKKRERERARA